MEAWKLATVTLLLASFGEVQSTPKRRSGNYHQYPTIITGYKYVPKVSCSIEIKTIPWFPLPSENFTVIAYCASNHLEHPECPKCQVANMYPDSINTFTDNSTGKCFTHLQLPAMTDSGPDRLRVTCSLGPESKTVYVYIQKSNSGNHCNNNLDCSQPAQCISGVCNCPMGQIFVNRLNDCYQEITGYDQMCLVDEQCQDYLAGTTCDTKSQQCTCPPLFKLQTSPKPVCISNGSSGSSLKIQMYLTFTASMIAYLLHNM